MEHYGYLVAGFCAALAVASSLVEVLRLWRGPSATLQNMRERALTWWVLLLVGVPVLAMPAPGPALLFASTSMVATFEYMTALGLSWPGVLAWTAGVLPLVFLATRDVVTLGAPALAASAALVVLLACTTRRRRLQVLGAALSIGGLASLAWLVRPEHPLGLNMALLVLVVTQLSDALQYVCGKLFGRHRLAPRVSPGKTVEGLVGGIVLAVVAGACLAPVWKLPLGLAAVVSAQTALLGVVSGLLLSAVKRRVGVKDWGRILKGHGGLLDRFDSLLLSAPTVAFEAAFLLPGHWRHFS